MTFYYNKIYDNLQYFTIPSMTFYYTTLILTSDLAKYFMF
jgi:hypothetical protein